MSFVKFKRPPVGVPDWETRIGVTRAKQHGRSWWALRFTDGTVVHEWDPDPGSPNGHVDWPRLRYQGRQALRLYCPNGQVPNLGGTLDCTGKLFQLKVGLRTVNIISNETVGQGVVAHLVGMVIDPSGACVCYAWEPLPEPLPPLGCPIVPEKPRPLDYGRPVSDIEIEYQIWRKKKDEFDTYTQSPAVADWKRLCQAWIESGKGRLVGPWDDNVWDLKYQGLGKLNADVLGLAVGEGR